MANINMFIQRVGTTGTITFKGASAQLYQNGTLLGSSTTGTFAHIPQGDGYVMKVTAANGTVASYSIAIGAIVDAMGASNMAEWFNNGTSGATAPHTYQLDVNGAAWGKVHGAAAQAFTAQLSTALGCPVGIIDSQSSGSSLLEQNETADGVHTYWDNGPAYAAALQQIDSIGGKVEDVIWAGGEPDAIQFAIAHDTNYQAEFQAGLEDFFSHIEADLGAPQIYIQTIGNCNNPNVQPEFTGEAQVEQQVADLLSYVSIGADGSTAVLADAHHYTPQSYVDLATAMAGSIASYVPPAPPPPPIVRVTADANARIMLDDGVKAIVVPGVTVIDPSVDGKTDINGGFGIGNLTGGGDQLVDWGTLEGFVGTYYRDGNSSVVVENGGWIYGYNAGVEFHDGGNNLLTVNGGGKVSSISYGVWFGATPHADYHQLPFSGNDFVRNFGLIEGDRREAIRMVEGGNHINNAGTIESDFKQAIVIDTDAAFARNYIVNSGSIVAGPRGAAIVTGDAALTVTNSGTITGDIQFGAGNDVYQGAGSVSGTVYGGAGNDVLSGGATGMTFDGGTGADCITLGAGSTANTLIYAGAGDSSVGVGVDTVDGFDFSRDHLVVDGKTITHFDMLHASAALTAHEAAVISNSHGVFLVVDENGQAGFQAGADLEIRLTDATHLPGSSS
jgi:carbohydrate esterase-like sialic acid-specific acetylesterase